MARKRPGPYAALSAFYADDEALMEAGEDAEIMFLRMIAYAARTPMTEGWISHRVCLTRLGISERPELGPETCPERRLETLREVNLINGRDSGWQIVSWLRWNRSVEEMGKEREQDRNRKRSLTREPPETRPETSPESGAVPDKDSAVFPTADTDTDTDTEKDSSRERADDRFDAFWKLYPKKGSKQGAKKKLATVLRRTEFDTVMDGLRRYVDHLTFHRTDKQFIKLPTTWLQNGCWEDEYDALPPDLLDDGRRPAIDEYHLYN